MRLRSALLALVALAACDGRRPPGGGEDTGGGGTDAGGDAGGDAGDGGQSADCRRTPCTGLSYCDLNTGACKPGCANDAQCGDHGACELSSHACSCDAGYHLCSGVCVSDASPASCGTRCEACPGMANATSSCGGGACGLACDTGFHLCGSACVANAEVAHCGTRCEPCPGDAHGSATCSGVQCGVSCNSGYHACTAGCVPDGVVQSCGARCDPCPVPAHGSATCFNGRCGIECAAGYHECSGVCASNASTATCGTRCDPCPAPGAHGSAVCSAGGACGISCDANYTPCGAACVNTQTDASNCGGCGKACAGASSLCVAGSCSCPGLGFGSPILTSNAATYPIRAIARDFNSDGKLDLALADDRRGFSASLSRLVVLLGDGTGHFTVGAYLGIERSPAALASGDVSGDGVVDLVATDSGDPLATTPLGYVSYFRGNGDGTFQGKLSVTVAGRPLGLAVGRFDADAFADAAVADFRSGVVRVFPGSAGGLTGGASLPVKTAYRPAFMATGDFNGDGKTDFAATSDPEGSENNLNLIGDLNVFIGDGAGSFTRSDYAARSRPREVVVGDFNKDGKQDLAVNGTGDYYFSFFRGGGNGTFAAWSPLYVGYLVGQPVAGDFNGDGNLDVAAMDEYYPHVRFAFGGGDGTFLQGDPFDTVDTYGAFAAGDFTQDGLIDLARAYNNGAVRIFPGQCP